MNTTIDQNITVINPVEVAKRLLLQWRAIVSLGILCGLILMLGKYYIDINAYQKASTAQGQTVQSEEVLENTLSDEELNAVDLAVKKYISLHSLESYLNNSMYINVDASSYTQLVLSYKVEPEGDKTAQEVMTVYQNYLSDERFINKVGKELGLDDDSKYIAELLKVLSEPSSIDDSGVLTVSFVIPNNTDEETVKAVLVDLIDESAKNISINSQELVYLGDSIRTYANPELERTKYSYESTLEGTKTYLNTAVAGLNESQLQLYNYKIEKIEKKGTNELEGSEPTINTAYVRKDMFVIGVLAGIVFYIAVFCFRLMFDGRLIDLNIENLTGLQTLGCINCWKGQKKTLLRMLLFDSVLYRMLYKDDMILQRPENIIGQMQSMVAGNEKKKFQLVFLDNVGANYTKEIETVAKSKNVELDVKEINASNAGEMLSVISTNVPTVIGLCAKKTKKRDVREFCRFSRVQNINLIGELHIEEC